jgi:hypothetical protein
VGQITKHQEEGLGSNRDKQQTSSDTIDGITGGEKDTGTGTKPNMQSSTGPAQRKSIRYEEA